jgi:hypothetical protein
MQSLLAGDYVTGPLFILIGIASRNNSASPTIDRSAIRSVEAHAPKPPLTRGYFIRLFDEGGNQRKRMIMLPGSMEGGNKEYQHAKTVLAEAGLLHE